MTWGFHPLLPASADIEDTTQAVFPEQLPGLDPGTSQPDDTFFSPTITFTLLVRYARPFLDTSTGSWTPSVGATLYGVLDESTASDTDYISTSAESTCVIKLNGVQDPLRSSGHSVKYRARSSTNNTLTVRVKQGDTVIATGTTAVSPSWQDYVMELSGSEADAITDYTNLYLEFEATP